MLEELGRQLLGAFYSSLSLSQRQADPSSGTTSLPQPPVNAGMCTFTFTSMFSTYHFITCTLTHTQEFASTVGPCQLAHTCLHIHAGRLVNWPPSVAEISDSAGSVHTLTAARGVFYVFRQAWRALVRYQIWIRWSSGRPCICLFTM